MPIDPTLSANSASNPASAIAPLANPNAPGGQGPGIQSQGAAGMGLKFASDLLALHQASKNAATQDLERNMKAAEAGFPVDQKNLVKLAKKAGLKIDNTPEGLASFISERTGNTQAGVPQSGKTPGQGAPQMGGGATAQGAPQQDPNKMSPKDRQKYVAEQWAANAVAAAHKRGADAQHLADLQGQVVQLKSDIINGNETQRREAVGKLMALNEIPFSIEKAEWEGADAAHKASMIDIAAGHESEKERLTRQTNMADSMLSSGRFTDPEAATKAAQALANGQPIPADVKAKMKPYTFSEMAEQAKTAEQLVELGIPPSRLGSTMAAMAAGGLQNALPPGVKPVVMQELAMKQQELGLEAKRIGIEGGQLGIEQQRLGLEQQRIQGESAHWAAEAKRADAALANEENKTFLADFTALMDAKKAGVKIPTDLQKGYLEELGRRTGMDVTETKGLFDYLTGGSTLNFTPKPNNELATKYAGSSPNAANDKNKGSGITKFYKSAKRAMSGETTD